MTKKIIGKGAFGEVKLVQRKRDGRIYALKSLVKTEMFKKDQLAHVRAERDILAESDSPWVVKLETTFQDNAYLYMLMEFLPGGDLMTMLIKYEIFSEDITRFYMAEIVLAIEAVHKLGYVHRYVKRSISASSYSSFLSYSYFRPMGEDIKTIRFHQSGFTQALVDVHLDPCFIIYQVPIRRTLRGANQWLGTSNLITSFWILKGISNSPTLASAQVSTPNTRTRTTSSS